jgi:hypothetical protein
MRTWSAFTPHVDLVSYTLGWSVVSGFEIVSASR